MFAANNNLKRKFSVLLLVFIFYSRSGIATEPLPHNLTDLGSSAGVALLRESSTETTAKLLSQFDTQKTPTYCGIASATIILNSMNIISPPADKQHRPFYYFTQDNFFNHDVKSILHTKDVEKEGVSLMNLGMALKKFNIKVQVYFANEININKFRKIISKSLENKKFIIVNFLRTELNQQGGGHHSPVAAYSRQTDQFLVLDVARYKYHAFWVKTKDLWRAVNTRDGRDYRGFIVMENMHPPTD